ncbi:ATP-binding protein [Streptomyces sp. NPDC055607]
MSASGIGKACCLGALSARLPAGLPGDAVAIPARLGDNVLHTLEALCPQLRPAVVLDLTRARTYLFTESGQGGVWSEDVWTLDAGTWFATPHQTNGPCGDLKVWRHWPESGGRVLPVTDLRRALRLAYPALRRRAVGPLVQHPQSRRHPVTSVSASAANGPDSQVYVFDRAPTVPALARRRVRAALTAWQVSPDDIDTAEQVIAELAANAIEHTESRRIRLEVERHPDEIQIAVRDSGPRPQTSLAARTDSNAGLEEGGRGLLLVHALAARWGADPTPGNGLRVWAAIRPGAPK